MRLIFKIWKEFVTSMLQDMLSVRQNLFSVTVVLIDENEMVDDGILSVEGERKARRYLLKEEG